MCVAGAPRASAVGWVAPTCPQDSALSLDRRLFVGRGFGIPNPGFQGPYGIAKRLFRVNTDGLGAGGQHDDLRADLLRGGRVVG